MNTRTHLLIALLTFPVICRCQISTPENSEKETEPRHSAVYAGFGVGLDYGGFGINVSALPDPHFALFGGVGYVIAGAGYNFGAKIRFNPKDRFCFTSGYMYGYNGALKVSGSVDYKKVYYGSSIFFGVDHRSRRHPRNFTSLKIIIPFHDPAFQNDVNYYNSLGANLPNPSSVNFSFGVHFGL